MRERRGQVRASLGHRVGRSSQSCELPDRWELAESPNRQSVALLGWFAPSEGHPAPRMDQEKRRPRHQSSGAELASMARTPYPNVRSSVLCDLNSRALLRVSCWEQEAAGRRPAYQPARPQAVTKMKNAARISLKNILFTPLPS